MRMEPFEIPCPHCSGKLRVTMEKLIGRRVNCPRCAGKFVVTRPQRSDVLDEEAALSGSGVGSAAYKTGIASNSDLHAEPYVPGHFQSAGMSDLTAENIENDELYGGSSVNSEHSMDLDDASLDQTDTHHYDEPNSSEYGFDGSFESGDYTEAAPPAPAKKKQDWMPIIVGAGIPGGIGLVLIIALLYSKGYLSPRGGGADWRQDGRRFQEFASGVNASDWQSQPPDQLERMVAAQIEQCMERFPNADFERYSVQLNKLRNQFRGNRISNRQYQQALENLRQQVATTRARVDPNYGSRRGFGSF